MTKQVDAQATETPRLIFIRQPEVLRRTALSRSTLYELILAGRFPKPLKLGASSPDGNGRGRINCWPEHEIEAWMQAQISEHAAASKANEA